VLQPATSNDLIVIQAATPFTLVWFGVSLLISALVLILVGWLLCAQRGQYERRDLLPLLAREHLSDGIMLFDQRGRLRWSNLTGRMLLLDSNSAPRSEAAALLQRTLNTHHVALQSMTTSSGGRVTVQALPMPGAVALIARSSQTDPTQNAFYERFLQRIVHDMRNPLAAIIAHAGNLQSVPDTRAAQIIENEALRLTRLVDSILFDARLSYVPLNAEALDLVDVIEEVLYQFDERAVREGKTIRVETPAERAPLEADRDLLVRALSNLLDNSLKYSKTGGVVRIVLETQPTRYMIRIIDNGDGIPSEYLPDKIFEALVRARPKQTGSGSGLGLAIVKKVVELHGGRIMAESVFGKGTAIVLWLPR